MFSPSCPHPKLTALRGHQLSNILSKVSLGLLSHRDPQYHWCYASVEVGFIVLLFFVERVQREIKEVVGLHSHQFLMPAPKFHTLRQSSMRFTDFQISTLFLCPTVTKDTAFQGYITPSVRPASSHNSVWASSISTFLSFFFSGRHWDLNSGLCVS